MHDPQFMKMLDAINQLMEQPTCFILSQSLIIHDVFEELSIFHVLHEQEQFLIGFPNIVQLHDVRMSHQLQDMDLSQHPLCVGNVADLAFFQHLDRHILARHLMLP